MKMVKNAIDKMESFIVGGDVDLSEWLPEDFDEVIRFIAINAVDEWLNNEEHLNNGFSIEQSVEDQDIDYFTERNHDKNFYDYVKSWGDNISLNEIIEYHSSVTGNTVLATDINLDDPFSDKVEFIENFLRHESIELSRNAIKEVFGKDPLSSEWD